MINPHVAGSPIEPSVNLRVVEIYAPKFASRLGPPASTQMGRVAAFRRPSFDPESRSVKQIHTAFTLRS